MSELNKAKNIFVVNLNLRFKISLTDYLAPNSSELLYFIDLQYIIDNKPINLFD